MTIRSLKAKKQPSTLTKAELKKVKGGNGDSNYATEIIIIEDIHTI